MRYLLFSDVHDDSVTNGVPREPEVEEFYGKILGSLEGIDTVVFSGDLCDVDSRDVLRSVSRFIALGIDVVARGVNFVAIPGNHGVLHSSRVVTTMSPLARVAEYDHWSRHGAGIFVAELPRYFERVNVLCLPYVSKRVYLSGQYIDAARDAFVDAAKGCVVVSHLTVPGAVLGNESSEMARGDDQLLPVDTIKRLEPSLVVNGHYHRRQTVSVGGLTVEVPGSPCSFSFDGDETDKGFLIAEV